MCKQSFTLDFLWTLCHEQPLSKLYLLQIYKNSTTRTNQQKQRRALNLNQFELLALAYSSSVDLEQPKTTVANLKFKFAIDIECTKQEIYNITPYQKNIKLWLVPDWSNNVHEDYF